MHAASNLRVFQVRIHARKDHFHIELSFFSQTLGFLGTRPLVRIHYAPVQKANYFCTGCKKLRQPSAMFLEFRRIILLADAASVSAPESLATQTQSSGPAATAVNHLFVREGILSDNSVLIDPRTSSISLLCSFFGNPSQATKPPSSRVVALLEVGQLAVLLGRKSPSRSQILDLPNRCVLR